MAKAYIKDVTDCLKVHLKNIKYDLAQNIISSEMPISLESIALNKIVVTLWQKDDSWSKTFQQLPYDHSDKTLFQDYEEWWSFCVKTILDKLSTLNIPTRFEGKLEAKVEEIGAQILRALFYFKNFPRSLSDNIRPIYSLQICWTYQGTINNLKTALNLIENTDISITEKYIISCNYCLETKIQELYNQLPEDFIKMIFDLYKLGNKKDSLFQFRLVAFWTYSMKGEREKFFEMAQKWEPENNNSNCLLKWAIETDNEVAIYYIWNKLKNEEMKIYLASGVRHHKFWRYREKYFCKFLFELINHSSNILYYLISQLSDLQFEALCEEEIYEMLGKFLDNCIVHDAILPTANYALQYIKLMKKDDALKILFEWKLSAFKKGQRQKLFSEVNVGDKSKFMKEITVKKHRVGTDYYFKLLCTGNMNIIGDFIRGMLENEKEANEFKEKMLNDHKSSLMFYIYLDGYKLVDDFLEQCCAEEKIQKFKHEFAYEYYKFDFTLGKEARLKFLNWCFDGNEEALAHYPEKIPFKLEK